MNKCALTRLDSGLRMIVDSQRESTEMLLIWMRIPASPPTLYSHRRSKEWNKISWGSICKTQGEKVWCPSNVQKNNHIHLVSVLFIIKFFFKSCFPTCWYITNGWSDSKMFFVKQRQPFYSQPLTHVYVRAVFPSFFFVKGFLNMYIYRENVRHSFSRTRNSIQWFQ